MFRFPYRLFALVLVTMFLPRRGSAAEQAVSAQGTLRSFFAGEGFGGAPLERRFGNHLFVSATINNKHTGIMIDTGAPFTLISKDSVNTLGLSVEKTGAHVGHVFGWTSEKFGVSEVKSMKIGNCVLSNVPVAIADESDLNHYSGIPHIDALFGAHEMLKFGVVLDCGHQMLYISPNGPSAGTSGRLAALLVGRGFTRVPLRLTSGHHFDVEAGINGHPLRLTVDSGAGTTLLAKEIAVRFGVVPAPIPLVSDAGDGHVVRLSAGYAKELSIGDFKITNAEVEMANVTSELGNGLLGEEHLSFNFAVIDVGGMNLYLRHADSR